MILLEDDKCALCKEDLYDRSLDNDWAENVASHMVEKHSGLLEMVLLLGKFTWVWHDSTLTYEVASAEKDFFGYIFAEALNK